MARPHAYDAALEHAVMDFRNWERKAMEDGAITGEEALALVPHIRERIPDLERIVMTNRARHALDNTAGGIDSPTFARVWRESRRRLA